MNECIKLAHYAKTCGSRPNCITTFQRNITRILLVPRRKELSIPKGLPINVRSAVLHILELVWLGHLGEETTSRSSPKLRGLCPWLFEYRLEKWWTKSPTNMSNMTHYPFQPTKKPSPLVPHRLNHIWVQKKSATMLRGRGFSPETACHETMATNHRLSSRHAQVLISCHHLEEVPGEIRQRLCREKSKRWILKSQGIPISDFARAGFPNA